MAAYAGSQQFDSRYCLIVLLFGVKDSNCHGRVRTSWHYYRTRYIMAGTVTITWETNQQKTTLVLCTYILASA